MRRPSGCDTITLAVLLLLSYQTAAAQQTAAPGDFQYYVLALSYAPDFCDQPGGRKDSRECGTGRQLGFVVHGLWPQGENSRGPERCAPASPVARGLVDLMLRYVPSASLIQHEWSTHGVCSGLNAADYFALVRKARDSVRIPADLDHPSQTLHFSPAEIETKLRAANPKFPPGAFTVSCYRDAELQEIRICFEKDLKPRDCSRSAGSCRVPAVTLLPVR